MFSHMRRTKEVFKEWRKEIAHSTAEGSDREINTAI